MSVFVSTTQQARHGVFAIEKTSQPQITPQGTDVAALVGQAPWGPANVLVTPGSPKDLTDMIAPPGIDRTNSFYLATIRKAFSMLKFVRVMAAAAVTATAALPDVTPATVVTVALKYPGIAGNSFTWTVGPASDGDTNHFNLTVTISGASGTSTETLPNLHYMGASTTVGDSVPDLSNSLLIGSITKTMATGGRPVNGSGVFTAGASPAVASADYVGTEGSGDKGIALLEGDQSVRHFFTDDPGVTFRAAVNAGASAHSLYMGDRIVYLNGNSGMTLAQVHSDVATYRNDRVIYCDPWVYILDDAGSRRLVPSNSFAGSVASQVSPSTSIGWKAAEVQRMLSGIAGLETDRGQGAGANTMQGVVTFIREDTGGHTMESDVTAMAPVDATRAHLTRRRITDFIAIAFVRSTRGFVDAPNVGENQTLLVNALISLLEDLKKNQSRDANHNPHIIDYAIGDLSKANSDASIAAGNFTIPADVRDSSGMYHIFLNINSGEGVTISEAA